MTGDRRYGAALSQHPIPAHAVGEVVGEVLEAVGPAPDLAVLFATAPLVGALDDIARAVRAVLNPRVLVGTSAVSVLGGATEVEETGALALWAARFGVDIEPVRLDAFTNADGTVLVAGGQQLAAGPGTLLLLVDPYSFPADQVLAHFRTDLPDLVVIGGAASSGRAAATNRMLLDDEVWTDGAVGVHLPPSISVSTVVSQGCRPVGAPFTVTKAERNVVYELGSRPALERLNEIIEGLSAEERQMAARGLHVGRVIDERKASFERGDFLVRAVIGADRSIGAVAVGDQVEVGDTVQFQVRDAESASEDLHALLAGRRAAAALAFTCNGRGSHLFGEPHHDARAISEALGGPPLSGMFCAGEIGPVGGQSFLHGFTASVALFDPR